VRGGRVGQRPGGSLAVELACGSGDNSCEVLGAGGRLKPFGGSDAK
jgi:hypothetical protein